MDDYYSSDEDVAWGTLTLREIKREFSKPIRQAVYRRTDFPTYFEGCQKKQIPTESTLSSNEEYCTANETAESELNTVQGKKDLQEELRSIKMNEDQEQTNSTTSSIGAKESNSYNKLISTPNKISEKRQPFDADIIYLSSDDDDDAGLDTLNIKSEKINCTNPDIICLSSDEDPNIIDVDVENSCDEKNEVSIENNVMIGVSRSLSTLNVSKHSLNTSRHSSNRNHCSMNEFIIRGITSREFIMKHSPSKFQKSINCRYSSNELHKEHGYQLNNSESSINLNSSKDLKHSAINESDGGMKSSELSNKLSSCEANENHEYEYNRESSGSSNSSNYVENFAANELIESAQNIEPAKFSLLSENHEYEIDNFEASGSSTSSNYVENLEMNKSIKSSEALTSSRFSRKLSEKSRSLGCSLSSGSSDNHEYRSDNFEASGSSNSSKYVENFATHESIESAQSIEPAKFSNRLSTKSEKLKCSLLSENHEYESDNCEASGSSTSSNYVENLEMQKSIKSSEALTPSRFSRKLSEKPKNFEYSLSSGSSDNHEYRSDNFEASGSSNSSEYVEKFDIPNLSEEIAPVESLEKISSQREKSKNHSYTSSNVDDNHIYELNYCEVSGYANSTDSSRSEYNEDEDLFLDDTLDVIKNLLSEEEAAGTRNFSQSEEPISRYFPHSEEPISRIPIFISASNGDIPNNVSSFQNFKVPSNPRTVKKSPFVDRKLTPMKKSPNRFKDIVSPIRVYINNSPLPYLKRNHRPIVVKHRFDLIQETYVLQSIKHRNILESLPEVIYKPSSQIKENFDNEMILPNNIRKLIKERIVIKHECRTRVNLNESEVLTSEKLKSMDLSYVKSDDNNMSLHTFKKGFRF